MLYELVEHEGSIDWAGYLALRETIPLADVLDAQTALIVIGDRRWVRTKWYERELGRKKSTPGLVFPKVTIDGLKSELKELSAKRDRIDKIRKAHRRAVVLKAQGKPPDDSCRELGDCEIDIIDRQQNGIDNMIGLVEDKLMKLVSEQGDIV